MNGVSCIQFVCEIVLTLQNQLVSQGLAFLHGLYNCRIVLFSLTTKVGSLKMLAPRKFIVLHCNIKCVKCFVFHYQFTTLAMTG